MKIKTTDGAIQIDGNEFMPKGTFKAWVDDTNKLNIVALIVSNALIVPTLFTNIEIDGQAFTDLELFKTKIGQSFFKSAAGGGGLTPEEKEKVDSLLTNGDGTKYLANDGTYKSVSGLTPEQTNKVNAIHLTGDGNKYLSEDGLYKVPIAPIEIGSVAPTDIAPSGDGIYRAKEAGTYTNLGGLVAKEGFVTWFKKTSSVWTLYSEVKINANMVAVEWVGGVNDADLTYPTVRAYKNSIYRVINGFTTVATDNPITSGKYENISGSYNKISIYELDLGAPIQMTIDNLGAVNLSGGNAYANSRGYAWIPVKKGDLITSMFKTLNDTTLNNGLWIYDSNKLNPVRWSTQIGTNTGNVLNTASLEINQEGFICIASVASATNIYPPTININRPIKIVAKDTIDKVGGVASYESVVALSENNVSVVDIPLTWIYGSRVSDADGKLVVDAMCSYTDYVELNAGDEFIMSEYSTSGNYNKFTVYTNNSSAYDNSNVIKRQERAIMSGSLISINNNSVTAQYKALGKCYVRFCTQTAHIDKFSAKKVINISKLNELNSIKQSYLFKENNGYEVSNIANVIAINSEGQPQIVRSKSSCFIPIKKGERVRASVMSFVGVFNYGLWFTKDNAIFYSVSPINITNHNQLNPLGTNVNYFTLDFDYTALEDGYVMAQGCFGSSYQDGGVWTVDPFAVQNFSFDIYHHKSSFIPIVSKRKIAFSEPNCIVVNTYNLQVTIPSSLFLVDVFDGDKFLFRSFLEASRQGQSSVAWNKKNFTFDYLNVKGDSLAVKFGSFISVDSFHIKSNWADALQCRDICNGRIWQDMLKHRPFPSSLGKAYVNNNINDTNSNIFAFSNEARYIPDGTPMVMNINGSFFGIYTHRMKKSRENYALDRDNKKNIFLDNSSKLGYLNLPFNHQDWDMKSPRQSGYVEGGVITDPLVLADIERFWSWCNGVLANTIDITTTYQDYIDLYSWIDKVIIDEVISNWDGNNINNANLMTWDGNIWHRMPYDLDLTLGILLTTVNQNRPAGFIMASGTLEQKVYTSFNTLVKQRYTDLRKNGVLSMANVIKIFNNWLSRFPQQDRFADFNKWGQRNGYKLTDRHLMKYFNDTFVFLDSNWLIP